METFIMIIAAVGWLLFVGLLVVWLRHYRDLIQVREQLKSKEVEAEFQKAALIQLKDDMKATFESLAQETLKGSNEQFLKMAELRLNQQSESNLHNFDKRKMEISNIVEPLKDTLGQFYKEVQTMEKERQRSYALVEKEIKKVVENSAELSKETRALKDALKKPHVRGRWGEVQLKNCVELAGMSEYADVSFQDSNDIDGKRLIPDMIVNMPGGRKVIVDAKTPIDAFLSSLEADTEEQRNAEMLRHGKQVKEHVKKLSLKAYGEVIEDSADFTVMFLPNESFLYAALETQPDLVEFAMEKKILLATPPTLVGLLKVIRYGWNEDKLAKNAQEISKIGTELHKRVADFVETFLEIGKSLDSAQSKYQQGLKRLNSRVLTQAKKMESLGAKSHKELPLDH